MSDKPFESHGNTHLMREYGLYPNSALLLEFLIFRQRYFQFMHQGGKSWDKQHGFFIMGGRRDISSQICMTPRMIATAESVLVKKDLLYVETLNNKQVWYSLNLDVITVSRPKDSNKPAPKPVPNYSDFANLIYPKQCGAELKQHETNLFAQVSVEGAQAILDTVEYGRQQNTIQTTPLRLAFGLVKRLAENNFDPAPANIICKQRRTKELDKQRALAEKQRHTQMTADALAGKPLDIRPTSPKQPVSNANVIPDNAEAQIQALTEQLNSLKGTGSMVRVQKMGLEAQIQTLRGNA